MSEYTPPKFTDTPSDYEFFKDSGLCGLSNFGNTCFMNSIIQCLSNTVEFTKYIISMEFQNELAEDIDIKDDEIKILQKQLIIQWYKLQRVMWSRNAGCGPRSFHVVIQLLSSKMGRIEFVGGHQKDAQEFFGFLMENMHMALCDEVLFRIKGKPKNRYDEMALAAAKSWKKFWENEYSKIIDLFYGQYYSTTKCTSCKYVSENYVPFCTISLPIPETDKPDINIYDCFSLFNKEEKLDIENKWKCEKCNEYIQPSKKISIWKKPKILTINFKRFTNDGRKLSNMISYPKTNLDISKYCYGYGVIDNIKYELYAVVNHTGGTGGGHYFAYIKNYNNKWYEMNDTLVTEINEKSVVNQNAYLLFYRQQQSI